MERPPAFSIGFALTSISLFALNLAVVRAIAERPLESGSLSGMLWLLWQSTMMAASGAGACWVAARTVRGRRWPIEPGLWLLTALGLAAWGQLFVEWLNEAAPRRVLASGGVYLVLLAATLTAPLLSRGVTTIWKIAVGGVLFRVIVEMLLSAGAFDRWPFAETAVGAAPLLVLPLLVGAVARDADRPQRSWLHWTGLTVWLLVRIAPPLTRMLFVS